MYQFDKARLDLAREFKAKPHGEHSPDLQYLLHIMRRPGPQAFPCLFMTRANQEWTLAYMEPGAKKPPRLTNHVFTDLAAAEWFVFKERWRELAGEDLPLD